MYNFQLGVDFAVDNFAECPPYMRETYHELAEVVNMPRLAHPDCGPAPRSIWLCPKDMSLVSSYTLS